MIAMTDTNDTNMVSPDSACPNCGECRVDFLIWVEEDTVRCATCGLEYEPLADLKEGNHDDR